MTQTDERIRQEIHETMSFAQRYADAIDALRRQCEECKLGKKPIGPRSGCEVRKKLIIEQSETAWKHKHLFFDGKGKCKMFQAKKESAL